MFRDPDLKWGPFRSYHTHVDVPLVFRATRSVSKTEGACPEAESLTLMFSLAYLKKKKGSSPPFAATPFCSLSFTGQLSSFQSPLPSSYTVHPHADALWTLGLNDIPLPQKAQRPTWSCYVETELLSPSRGKARGKTRAVLPAFLSYQLSGSSITSSIKTQGSLFSTCWASTVYWAVSWVLGRQCEPTDMVPVLTGTGRMGSGRRRHSQVPASGLQFEL